MMRVFDWLVAIYIATHTIAHVVVAHRRAARTDGSACG
jgi:hypothetical protein